MIKLNFKCRLFIFIDTNIDIHIPTLLVAKRALLTVFFVLFIDFPAVCFTKFAIDNCERKEKRLKI
jgi:hypothetical protein